MLMNRKSILSAAILLSALTLSAKGIHHSSASLDVENGKMVADMILEITGAPLKSTQKVVMTPYILSQGGDSISFDSFSLYGRRSLINARRLNQPMPAHWAKNEQDTTYTFHETVDYTPELNGAQLALRLDFYGCANCLKETQWFTGPVWEAPTFDPATAIVFEVPTANVVKERAASGRANVEFPVNRTELRPDFRNNAAELAKVAATIDSVKDDPDVTITAIYVKGFASPEGSYANNTRLAKGRTEALCQWIENRYKLPHSLVHTSYEPEDWEGLRDAVEADHTLPNRDGLLGFITDTSLEPDTREFKMRSYYPGDYKRLLNEVYPSLRHTDYRVEYTIRSFTSPEEIFAVMEKDPTKLTAAEYFAAAQTLDPNDPKYAEVLTLAAINNPQSEEANLNAASVSLKNGDLDAADSFLRRAGDSPAADYTRGLLAVASEDYTAAEKLLKKAQDAGYEPAAQIIEKISLLKKINR